MGQYRLCCHLGEIISFFSLPNDYFSHAISMPQVRHKLEEQ